MMSGLGLAVSTSSDDVIAETRWSLSSTSRRIVEFVIRSRCRQNDLHPKLFDGFEKFACPGQRAQQRRGFFVVAGVQILRPSPGVVIRTLGEGRDEAVAVHADRAVDAPRVDRDSDVGECAIPGVDVEIVRVDEGAVDIEQHGRCGLAFREFHER